MSMKKWFIIGIAVTAALNLWAQAPGVFRYQGRLVDGTNLVNATLPMSFKLYDAQSAGRLLYEDSNSVLVVDGLYSTYIGDDTVFGSLTDAITNATVYLELTVNGETLLPRERLVSVPYALNSTSQTNGIPLETLDTMYQRLDGSNVGTNGSIFLNNVGGMSLGSEIAIVTNSVEQAVSTSTSSVPSSAAVNTSLSFKADEQTVEGYGFGGVSTGKLMLVSFTDDDGIAADTVMVPTFAGLHVPLCVAIPFAEKTAWGTFDYWKAAQDNYGVEIMSHSYHHAGMDAMSLATFESECSNSLAAAKAHGIRMESLIYPGGYSCTQDQLPILRKYFRSAMAISPVGVTQAPINQYFLGRVRMDTNSLAQMQASFTNAYACTTNISWLIYYSHAYVNTSAQQIATISNFVAWAKVQPNTKIVTTKQALDVIGNIIEVGDRRSTNYYALSRTGAALTVQPGQANQAFVNQTISGQTVYKYNLPYLSSYSNYFERSIGMTLIDQVPGKSGVPGGFSFLVEKTTIRYPWIGGQTMAVGSKVMVLEWGVYDPRTHSLLVAPGLTNYDITVTCMDFGNTPGTASFSGEFTMAGVCATNFGKITIPSGGAPYFYVTLSGTVSVNAGDEILVGPYHYTCDRTETTNRVRVRQISGNYTVGGLADTNWPSGTPAYISSGGATNDIGVTYQTDNLPATYNNALFVASDGLHYVVRGWSKNITELQIWGQYMQ